jgi:hypothetical protein
MQRATKGAFSENSGIIIFLAGMTGDFVIALRILILFSSITPRACKCLYRLKWTPHYAYFLENCRVIL